MKKSILLSGLLLSSFLFLFLAQKINLPAADIGRHIKNGDVFLHATEYGVSRSALLHTNFFSFTFPDFPFINHHWGYGIIAYLTYSMFGWTGLSFAYIISIIGAFFTLFILISKKIPLYITIPVSLFLIPLIAERTEIRPEGMSYLFIASFLYILVRFSENTLSKKYLYVLPLLSILWINLHIYAALAPLMVGAFLCESLIRKDWEKVKTLSLYTILCACALLISPYGLEGALYPFNIFQNYGYLVAENQSITFLEKLRYTNPNFLWWKISAFLVFISSISVLIYKKNKFPIALGCMAIAFGGLSFLGIRHLSLFGLILLPFLAYTTSIFFTHIHTQEDTENLQVVSIILSLFLIISTCIHFSDRLPGHITWGFGLLPHNNDSATFVTQTHIGGPFFSNYDIGGLLIFTLFTPERKEHVFVDNRPETYPKEFFSNIYIPMQENPAVWEKQSETYNINAVWFYRLDSTPWAQHFLITLIKNQKWAPVYADDYTIIFLKRVEKNQTLIHQFELPQSMFTVQ